MLITTLSSSDRLSDNVRHLLSQNRSLIVRTTHPLETTLDFASSVAEGLSRTPRRLDCRYLYDAQGSQLYEQITRQPEYYLTRTEAAILARHAADICKLTGPVNLLELGSGSSLKTDYLLSAYLEKHPTLSYLPVDISQSALEQAGRAMGQRYPGLQVIGINGTYQEAFSLFSDSSPLMVMFLGSTIGNQPPEAAAGFLEQVARHLERGDYFLLGIDLVKDQATLEAAYNDEAGVTEAFTRNLFARMNRELGSTLEVSAIEHRAHYNKQGQQVEINARFNSDQTIDIKPTGQSFAIAAGEQIQTEISRKFRIEQLVPELEACGLKLRKAFSDERNWFALLLLQRCNRSTLERTVLHGAA